MKTSNDVSSDPPLWEVEQRVVQILSRQLDVDIKKIRPETRLIEDLGLDSLELAEFIMNVEDTFDITISDSTSQRLFPAPVTVRDFVLIVISLRGTGKADRKNWKVAKQAASSHDDAPFTQLDGSLDERDWLVGPLYEPIGSNREGFKQLRRRTDGMRCVLIPTGSASIGHAGPAALPDQLPVHQVQLRQFLIDAEPVLNMAYCRFLNSVRAPEEIVGCWFGVPDSDGRRTHVQLERKHQDFRPVPGTEEHPVVLVSWYGANAYSLWASRRDWRRFTINAQVPKELASRNLKVQAPDPDWLNSCLPSEAQWEYAARGGAPNASSLKPACVACHALGTDYRAEDLPSARVSARLGMSPFGLHHMAGNVWQWCRDWYSPDFYSKPDSLTPDAQNIEDSGIKAERGGSWVGPEELAEPAYRRGRPPNLRGRCLGFRCVGKVEAEMAQP